MVRRCDVYIVQYRTEWTVCTMHNKHFFHFHHLLFRMIGLLYFDLNIYKDDQRNGAHIWMLHLNMSDLENNFNWPVYDAFMFLTFKALKKIIFFFLLCNIVHFRFANSFKRWILMQILVWLVHGLMYTVYS